MRIFALALTGLMLTAVAPGLHAAAMAKPAAKARSSAKAASKAAPVKPPTPASPDATRVMNWVGGSGDNHKLPYIVIDKVAARAFLFDGKGKRLGDAPVLVGIATGDDATPDVGKKSLAALGPAEKTTPAGRYLAKFGVAAGQQRVLWVDYATSVALHTIPTGNPKEKRRERMLSATAGDNRITFGCINVPKAFYSGKVSPQFRRKGGYVYVLPDTKSLEDVFPPIRVQPFLAAQQAVGGGSAGQ